MLGVVPPSGCRDSTKATKESISALQESEFLEGAMRAVEQDQQRLGEGLSGQGSDITEKLVSQHGVGINQAFCL